MSSLSSRRLLQVASAAMAVLALWLRPERAWAKPRSVEWFYGTAWWEEQEDDERTGLLAHFGKPQVRQERVQAVEKQEVRKSKDSEAKVEEDLGDVDESGTETAGPAGLRVEAQAERALEEEPIEPIQDGDLPAGTVLDYRVHDRRKVEGRLKSRVQGGAAIVETGRFGQGLRCAGGKGGVRFDNINYNDGRSVECSIWIDKYPQQTQCVLSANRDEGQVLIHPDGSLELKLKKPHGVPDQGHWTKEFYQAILRKDATVIAREPVPLGEWVHVVAAMKDVVVQGAGSPFCAALLMNGVEKASYTSEVNNGYSFLGRWSHPAGRANLVIGNNEEMTMGFEGRIDEVRISTGPLRVYYERPPLVWRDVAGKRKLEWDWPFFHRDGMIAHAGLDGSADVVRSPKKVQYLVHGEEGVPGYVDGVRGQAVVAGPNAGLLRVPLDRASALQGSIEFWFRPQNWDNTLGYWSPDGPPRGSNLSVVRLVGRDKGTGEPITFIETRFSRAYAIDHGRKVVLDPGHWRHVLVGWYAGDMQRAFTFIDGKWSHGSRRTVPEERTRNIEPLYVEFGVTHDPSARIEVDEIAAYDEFLSNEELVRQAMRRWMGNIEPLQQAELDVRYKWSIGKLSVSLKTKNILNDTADQAVLRLVRRNDSDPEDQVITTPVTRKIEKDACAVDLVEGKPLEPGQYFVVGRVVGTSGKTIAEFRRPCSIRREPWRDNRIGYLEDVPEPWTPIEFAEREVRTRMTRYVLTEDGLPGQIAVAGEDILAAPVTLEERGTRLAGTPLRIISKKRHEADWSSTFTASGARMTVTSHIEYEGLIRYTLAIEPSGAGQVGPLRIVIPIKRSAATHYLYNLAGQTGARADLVPGQDGLALSSRLPRFWHEQGKARQAKPDSPARELKFSEFQAYAFFTQLGLCNLDRGLYWFADNANGWQLSSRICAQEVFRKGETTEIRLNLIAEPGTLDGKRTIVFGLLPHPARPMPEKWRRFDRADLQKEPLYCSISNAFQPWPMEPRTHGMQVFPAPDPRKPDDGPSYEYAQRCAKSFSDSYPHGFRSIYLSKYWFSCRAGAYDHWEWRSGEGMRASLSQSFVDYLVWEMDQWIGKDIYTAIYLDECYEAPNGNVESGDATLLPDGTVLPGANLWGFRDLMKRWRHLFHVYRKPPMIVGHLTGSFMYPGIVFCDAFLDGEGSPTITASGGSFIQHTSRHRLEVINSQHWGVAPFYMVSIWEGGLGKGKGWNPHTRWSWRMARSAMARLLPFENGTMYTDQGSQVYRAVASDLARFGADEDDVAFYPYWRNADSFSLSAGPQSRYNPVPDTKDVIVCFYKRESRILVIVSNWDTRNKDVLIALNKAKLGLPDTFTVRDWDSSLQPDPKSLDIYSSEEMKKTLAGVKLDVSLTERPAESEAPREGGADDEETAVEDELREGGKETRESEESRIRIDPHGRIFVRLRQQDFRMFVVNPPPEEAASPESPQSQPTRLRDTEEP